MQEEYFSTSDLGLAAALITWGYPLKKVQTTGRKSEFYFQHNDVKDNIVLVANDYWESQLRLFFDNLKMIKTRLYSQ